MLAQSLSIFDPASPSAHSIVNLAILALVVAGLIFRRRRRGAALFGLAISPAAGRARPASRRRSTAACRSRSPGRPRPRWSSSSSCSSPPARSGKSSRSCRQPQPGDNALFVTVIGHQWWWEYVYESYDGRTLGFVTANELHIPVSDDDTSRPVYLTLKSADVCHSFWVPRLGGKIDLIPGRVNSMWFRPKEAGLYLGQCAEYCGAQHANMLLRVVVDSPEEFERWLANEAQPAVEDPAVREGKAAFLAQSCVNCHAVRGTPARGTYAPDLTHLMSRETLASGMIENTPETLGSLGPRSADDQARLPDAGVRTDDRNQQLIVDYLRTLR